MCINWSKHTVVAVHSSTRLSMVGMAWNEMEWKMRNVTSFSSWQFYSICIIIKYIKFISRWLRHDYSSDATTSQSTNDMEWGFCFTPVSSQPSALDALSECINKPYTSSFQPHRLRNDWMAKESLVSSDVVSSDSWWGWQMGRGARWIQTSIGHEIDVWGEGGGRRP